ncbi:MAG: hypothetical protein MJA30_36970, partial [Cytophagales bacterium]|nr:hypothetical protein [Cytophagales bacterium]
PGNYSPSTAGRFDGYSCKSPPVGLPPSYTQHVKELIPELSLLGTPCAICVFCKEKPLTN